MTGSRPLHAKTLAFSLASFIAIAYVACLTLGLIVPDRGLHTPWLQFFPGFTWSFGGVIIGFVEGIAYGFISGLVFAPIYNFFSSALDD